MIARNDYLFMIMFFSILFLCVFSSFHLRFCVFCFHKCNSNDVLILCNDNFYFLPMKQLNENKSAMPVNIDNYRIDRMISIILHCSMCLLSQLFLLSHKRIIKQQPITTTNNHNIRIESY